MLLPKRNVELGAISYFCLFFFSPEFNALFYKEN